jgi:hypothetical protein
MTLIVEDGTGLPDAESYVSVEDAQTYAERRGLDFDVSPPDDLEAALRRATTWIDATYGPRFGGTRKNGRAQALQWPRADATDAYGEDVPDDEVPVEVVHATIEAAVRELATPGGLNPDYVGTERVVREKVGDLEVQYADGKGGADDARPVISVIDGILAPLIGGASGVGLFGSAARA